LADQQQKHSDKHRRRNESTDDEPENPIPISVDFRGAIVSWLWAEGVSHGCPRQLRTGAEELPPQRPFTFPSGVLFSQVDAESKDEPRRSIALPAKFVGDWCLAEHAADIWHSILVVPARIPTKASS
jgi:hypothetical protein